MTDEIEKRTLMIASAPMACDSPAILSIASVLASDIIWLYFFKLAADQIFQSGTDVTNFFDGLDGDAAYETKCLNDLSADVLSCYNKHISLMCKVILKKRLRIDL